MNKYKNTPYQAFGRLFDSKKEAVRFHELMLLQKAGKIRALVCQREFPLIATRKYGNETVRGCKYIADFYYYDIEHDEYVVEDVKGFPTPEYIVKKKIFLEKYVYTGECSFIEYGQKIKYFKKMKKNKKK